MDTRILKKSVIIFGCGYIGSELAKVCLGKGWSVTALTRNLETSDKIRQMGVQVYTGKLESDSWWEKITGSYDFVINTVGAASPSVQGYEQSYLHGMRSILGWIVKGGRSLQSLLFTSSSSVYPQADGSLVNEESSTKGVPERGRILLAAENECLSGIPQIAFKRNVIRFSGLYGPGRHLLVDKIREGEPMGGCPDRYLNLLHRDDAVSAILSVLNSAGGSGIFNACDGQHATRGQIARWVANRLGVPAPVFTGTGSDRGGNRRVDSSKLMQSTKWVPKFSNFQSGYEDFLATQ